MFFVKNYKLADLEIDLKFLLCRCNVSKNVKCINLIDNDVDRIVNSIKKF